MDQPGEQKQKSGLLRWLLWISGFLSLGLGILGVFLPLLPTTPFLLLAAACFLRSSRRAYRWLMTNRWLGSYIRNYRENRAVDRRTKIVTLILLWVTISVSALAAVKALWIRILLFLIAVGVTIHVLSLKTVRKLRQYPGENRSGTKVRS
jgi:uncharacterized membrane protein YbaN (DUF454 family)